MIRRMILVVFLTLLIPLSQAAAQTPPSAITEALADLGKRAGQTLTLEDLTGWTWSQQTYPDTSLGCPQSGESYQPVETRGYQIILVYNGATFDYRAPVTGGAVFLCSGPATISPAAPRPTNTPAPTAATTTSTNSVCPGAMNTRLATGIRAAVRDNGIPNNIRSQPTTTSAQIGRIPSGASFVVVGGPTCAQNIVWWQISYESITGWTAEGQNGVYWLEPVTTAQPTAIPLASTPITPELAQVFTAAPAGQTLTLANAGLLVRLAELPLSEKVTGLAWTQTTLAATVPSGIWLYNADALTQPPRLLRIPNAPVNAVAASPTENLLATAHDDATVRIWDIGTGGQRAVLRGHTQPVYAVAFSPDGTLLASGGGSPDTGEDSAIHLWDAASGAPRAALEGHSAPVTALAFSPDGTLLVSASADNSVRLWDVITNTPGTVLSTHTAPVRAVAFSPDGTWIASAGDDGTISLWNTDTGDQRLLAGHTGPVRAVIFSQDGTVLLSAGGSTETPNDNSLRMWDVASGVQIAPLDSYGGQPESVIQAMTLNPDGSILAFATFDQFKSTVRLWSPAQ